MALFYEREEKHGEYEEKFAGMTRAEVLEAAHAINQELDENDWDSNTYSEYIEAMEVGQEELRKHAESSMEGE